MFDCNNNSLYPPSVNTCNNYYPVQQVDYSSWEPRPNVPTRGLSAFEEILIKKQIDIQGKIYLENEREARRNRRKAQYDEICIERNGSVYVIPKNSIVTPGQREMCNFKSPKLVKMISTDGDHGVFKLTFVLDDKDKQVFLLESKLGKGQYILEKIHSVGGDIKADRKTEQYASKLMAVLMKSWEEDEEEIIPAHVGWVQIKKKWEFVERGSVTWKEILEKAK